MDRRKHFDSLKESFQFILQAKSRSRSHWSCEESEGDETDLRHYAHIIMLPGPGPGPGSVLCMIHERHVILKTAFHFRLAV